MENLEIWEVHKYIYSPFKDRWRVDDLILQGITETFENARLFIQQELEFTIDEECAANKTQTMLHVHRETTKREGYRCNMLIVRSSIWRPKPRA